MPLRPWLLAVLLCSAASLCPAQIAGTVKLDGKAPEPKEIDMSANPECARMHPDPVMEETVVADDAGHLANVIVSIVPEKGQDLSGGEAKKGDVVLDQKGCMYVPHVVALQVGQTLVVKNSDLFMHNVHTFSEKSEPMNESMPTKNDEGLKLTDLKPEIFMTKCDVHPWMKAWVGVFAHSYFAVTKDDGTYSIDTKGLKDGQYTLQAWQEKLGTQSQKITVSGGKATADFAFKTDAGKADAGAAKEMPCCRPAAVAAAK